jgi:hypothetical protein
LNGGRRSWLKNRHRASIPSTGGIYQWSWRSFTGAWPGLRANAPPRPCNYLGRSWKSPMLWSTWVCSHLRHPYATEVSTGCPNGGEPYFRASIGGTHLRRRSLGLKLGPSSVATAPSYPACCLFCAFSVYVMYVSIFLYL